MQVTDDADLQPKIKVKPSRMASKKEKKLEKIRLAVEGAKQRKRDELERELAAHAMWKIELDRVWLPKMLEIKSPVYRKQIEAMRHILDRAYDKKDGLIHHLIHLRDLANFQYQRTLGSFCVDTDNIIVTFLSDLENMSKKNAKQTEDMVAFGLEEINHFREATTTAETHLNILLYIGHDTADNLAWNTRGENNVRKDEEFTNFQGIRETLSAILEGNYCYMWEVYTKELKGYVAKTAENMKELRSLRKKEQKLADIIAAQARKLVSGQNLIKRLRSELFAYESGEQQAGFRDRRNRHRDAWEHLKKSMNHGVEIDKKQLARLVRASDDTVEWIQAAQKKCEKILRLAALCRKYETRREKIMPYGFAQVSFKKEVRTYPRTEQDPLIVSTQATTCSLTNFWRRISEAELSKRALLREKMLLEQENARLERKLEEEDEENERPRGPDVNKCVCAEPVPIKKASVRVNAIEGSIESKKFFRS